MFDFSADPSTRLRPRCVVSRPYGTAAYSPPAQRCALVRAIAALPVPDKGAAVCVDQRAPSPSMTTLTVLNRIRISSSREWFFT